VVSDPLPHLPGWVKSESHFYLRLMLGRAGVVRGVRWFSPASKTQLWLQHLGLRSPVALTLEGSLSSARLGELRTQATSLQKARVLMDLTKVSEIEDASALKDILSKMKENGCLVAVKGAPEDLVSDQSIKEVIAHDEKDVHRILFDDDDRLAYGVQRFRSEAPSYYKKMFKKLESSQAPHTLFITCSDSRINPHLITYAEPGELFLVRNVGNQVPAYKPESPHAEAAAIEFSVKHLGVSNIVVCGHSECGAMRYCLTKLRKPEGHSFLTNWLEQAKKIPETLPETAPVRDAAELNVKLQIDNLKTYPVIQEKMKAGKLTIRGWYYDIGNLELEEYNEKKDSFEPIGVTEAQDK